MDLQPGCLLLVAPRFHLAVDWADRLLLGRVEPEDDRFFPGPSWRPATPDELDLLVARPDTPLTEAQARGLCLLALPRHLLAGFWSMLEADQESAEPHLAGFDHFAGEVGKFLDFKGAPVGPGAVFDLVASRPGQRSIQWDPGRGLPIGLTFDRADGARWPPEEPDRTPRLWGGFNLGDEPVSLLFVNLTARQMQETLARDFPESSPPATLDELGRRFLSLRPDYPLVRLRIEPGEGYRVPPGGVLIDACTLEAKDPGVLLMVRLEEPGSAS
jgi:hypothetical protein